MEHEHDRREFTRVQVKLQAELMSGGNVVIQGQLGNVSFNGMLLDCAVSLPEGTALPSLFKPGWGTRCTLYSSTRHCDESRVVRIGCSIC